MDHASAIKMAEAAQTAKIKWALTNEIVRSRRVISELEDCFFWSAFTAFNAAKIANIRKDAARRQLDRLCKTGEIERIKYVETGIIGYRFPRARCDEIATQVRAVIGEPR